MIMSDTTSRPITLPSISSIKIEGFFGEELSYLIGVTTIASESCSLELTKLCFYVFLLKVNRWFLSVFISFLGDPLLPLLMFWYYSDSSFRRICCLLPAAATFATVFTTLFD